VNRTSVFLLAAAVAVFGALVLMYQFVASPPAVVFWGTLAVSAAITAANIRLAVKVRRERRSADLSLGIPGLAGARSEGAMTRRFTKASFPDLWSSATVMATWLVDWHLAVHPSTWTPRIADFVDGYQPLAVDLVALALVDTARAEEPDGGPGIGMVELDAAARRLSDPSTAFQTLRRATAVPLDTGRRLASLELMYQRSTQTGPDVVVAEIDGAPVEIREQHTNLSVETLEAVLFAVGTARQVLDAHARQTAPHGRLRDRYPALARLETIQRAADHTPRRGPYKGAPPLNSHRRAAALLAQELNAERRRTATPVPPSQMREYLLLIAVCEDRAALLWGQQPPEEISERAEDAAKRLVDWDTAHPPETATPEGRQQWQADPRAYVRHVYASSNATPPSGNTGPR